MKSIKNLNLKNSLFILILILLLSFSSLSFAKKSKLRGTYFVRYGFQDISLNQIFKEKNKYIACFIGEDGKTAILRKGYFLGWKKGDHGSISLITENSVEIDYLVEDDEGDWIPKKLTLFINENSIKNQRCQEVYKNKKSPFAEKEGNTCLGFIIDNEYQNDHDN